MCCSAKNESPTKKWLKVLLFIWLLANFCRQTFDLIGRLWIPLLVNLIQILILIAGLFAVFQTRFVLLIVLSISCIFSILYNVTLILWYTNFFGSTNRPLLSLGLPHGYSFFVQHTPFCDSSYNVSTARWTQHESCLVPYGYIESFQASLHILLALLTAIFSILVARQRKINALKQSKAYASRTQLNKMHIAASSVPKPNCKAPNSNSSTSYLNSSYENPENLVEVPQMRRKTIANSSAKLARNRNVEQSDNFSSAPTIELNSNKSGSTNAETSEQPKPQKILRALPERRSCGAQLAKILDQSIDSNTSRYSKIDTPNGISHSRRRSEYHLRPTASANNAVKLDNSEEDSEYMETRSRIAARLANLNGEPVVNKTSPYHKRQGSAGNLTSLISFDPKSETLIQVHEHQQESDEDEILPNDEEEQFSKFDRPHSRDSAPVFPAPPAPPNVFTSEQSDSGHHSTNSNNSANWSQGGISFPSQFQSNYMPITQSHEISHRFNQTKSPESINYEQVGYPLVATAFPVTHSRQRSYCGVSVSTSIPLAKQSSPPVKEKFYNKDFQQQDPIVPTHFSRAFHNRWVSGDKSHEDLPPPPKPTKLNTTNLPQEHHSDPRIEGLLV